MAALLLDVVVASAGFLLAAGVGGVGSYEAGDAGLDGGGEPSFRRFKNVMRRRSLNPASLLYCARTGAAANADGSRKRPDSQLD